jgi:hypothetical protein
MVLSGQIVRVIYALGYFYSSSVLSPLLSGFAV